MAINLSHRAPRSGRADAKKCPENDKGGREASLRVANLAV